MSKELLVGLTGRAGSGKDTVARFMTAHGYFHRYALAGPIKTALEVMLDLDHEVWNDRTLKEAPVEWIGKSPRELAQLLGTEWGRDKVDPDLWIKLGMRQWELVRSDSVTPRMVITDVRFDNEARAVRDAGGTVWRVLRENIPEVRRHVSEAGVSRELITGDIKNYGSLSQLETNVIAWCGFLLKRYAR